LNIAGMDVSAAVFAEYGAAWFENVSGSAGDERSIADAGVRVSADLGWGVSLDAVAATPLTDDGFVSSSELERLEADFYVVLKKVF
jgi:hemolysin activation/secretion protein